MTRIWIVGLLLLGCRTPPFEPGEVAPVEAGEFADLGAKDLAARDLRAPDLSGATENVCGPKHPDGVCPSGSTCCPFSCWGGNDATGWCFKGPGCPVC